MGYRGDKPKRHPLKVRSDGVHLALVDADLRAVIAEGFFCVVEMAETVPIPIVGDFYIISEVCYQTKYMVIPWSSQTGIQAKF